ncbi:MAG TPA: metal-dependent transcriptional regulator, partial [Anaerolineales bacterium]|nr:metal-dependent transcriptional regulator [Anaerolineales bacterium]
IWTKPVDKLSPTIENYLSLMYVLELDKEPVLGVRLAQLLSVTPPTVTNTLKRMVRDGLITMDKDGTRLTKAGKQSARTVVRRHMLTEWMMARILPWSKLHQEAHHLEHAISAEVETALYEEMGHPQTCPHGNPLPGAEDAVSAWIPVTEASPNDVTVIKRIHELAEYNLELLVFLEGKGLVTGAEVIVREVLPFNQTVTLEIQGQIVTLGFASAQHLFVEPRT